MISYRKIKQGDKEKTFQYLSKNKSENALLLYDLKNLYPDAVNMNIVLKDKQIKGLSLSWYAVESSPSIHIRIEDGEIAEGLIDRIKYKENFRIVSPRKYSKNIKNCLENYKNKNDIYFMTSKELNFENKSENPELKSKKLSNKDIFEVKELFKNSTETDEGLEKWVMSSLDKEIIFGSFKNDEPCSIAGTLFQYENISMIGNVFTKKEKRGQGMATFTLSSLSNHLSEKDFKELQIYAVEDSAAHHLYKKLGFKEKKEYVRLLI